MWTSYEGITFRIFYLQLRSGHVQFFFFHIIGVKFTIETTRLSFQFSVNENEMKELPNGG